MKTRILAVGAVLAAATAAAADVVVAVPGGTFTEGQGNFVVTTPLQGTLTGIIVSFTYANGGVDSWQADVAATVGINQWGGYTPSLAFANGATTYIGATGAPNVGGAGPVNFTSAVLNLPGGQVFNNQTANVGIGNGYNDGNPGGGGSIFTVSNVSITLVGVEKIPAPGALALLGLAGVIARRRRA